MVARFLAALLFFLPLAAEAAPVTPEDLRRHIEILASDEFEGREPGTEGERKTIAYISGQFRALGLEPAAGEGGWYQPVALTERRPGKYRARWKARRSSVRSDLGGLILLGKRPRERIAKAPVYFAGYGAVAADLHLDQLAGADLKGAVVFILYHAPDTPGFKSFDQRVEAVAQRGAAAVIGIFPRVVPWHLVQAVYESGQSRLDIDPAAPIEGAIGEAEAERLFAASGASLGRLSASAAKPSFTPVRQALSATLDVDTETRSLISSNVIARLRGTGGSGESVMYLGHWDHFGLCRPAGAPDRICNGAVDNASGIAALLEVARGLAAGPRPVRDVVFMATTAEEAGLLGATYFAARPTVPLASIVAAFNLDTVAIAGKGRKVAVIGRPDPRLDALIEQSAHALGREMDRDHESDAFEHRQDGWALAQAGVPALMVGGSFSNMAELQAFLSGPYHQPNDDLAQPLRLEGAAEDAELMIALGRKLADPGLYQPPAALARP